MEVMVRCSHGWAPFLYPFFLFAIIFCFFFVHIEFYWWNHCTIWCCRFRIAWKLLGCFVTFKGQSDDEEAFSKLHLPNVFWLVMMASRCWSLVDPFTTVMVLWSNISPIASVCLGHANNASKPQDAQHLQLSLTFNSHYIYIYIYIYWIGLARGLYGIFCWNPKEPH